MTNTATSPTTRENILEAARKTFIDLGYHRFSMRKVATAANISLGNLNYYFPRKEALLQALMEMVVERYVSEFERRRYAAGASPASQLEAVLDYWMDDLLSRETTVFFPELWALANHEADVAVLTDRLYRLARKPLLELIPQINPARSPQEVEEIALLMCASMEGLTVFAGFEKPWSSQFPALKRRLINNLMDMIA